MNRYDLVIFTYNDDDATLYPIDNGKWVRYDEAQEKINFLVTALQSLKDCNVKLQSPEALNEFIDRTLQGFIHE